MYFLSYGPQQLSILLVTSVLLYINTSVELQDLESVVTCS